MDFATPRLILFPVDRPMNAGVNGSFGAIQRMGA